MKKSGILPGAAGIIALTATIGFVDGQRELESEDFLREKVTLVSTKAHFTADGESSGDQPDIVPGISAYQVEIRRGDVTKIVLIDAASGKILLS